MHIPSHTGIACRIESYENGRKEQPASLLGYFDFSAVRNSMDFVIQCHFFISLGLEVSTFLAIFGCYLGNFLRAEF